MAFPLIPVAIGTVVVLAGGGYFLMRKSSAKGGIMPPVARPTDGVHDDYGAGLADGANDGAVDGKNGLTRNPRPLINYSTNPDAQKKYDLGYGIGYDGSYASAYALSKIEADSVDPGGTPTVEETETKKPSTGADRTQGQTDGSNYGFMMGQMAAISSTGGSGIGESEAKDNAKRSSGWQFGTKNYAYNQGWEEGFNGGWSKGVASVLPAKTGAFGRPMRDRVRTRRTVDMSKVRKAYHTGALAPEGARRLAMLLDTGGSPDQAKEVRALYNAEEPTRVGAMHAAAQQASHLPPWMRPGGARTQPKVTTGGA